MPIRNGARVLSIAKSNGTSAKYARNPVLNGGKEKMMSKALIAVRINVLYKYFDFMVLGFIYF
jgi:hypothetical protein